MDSHWRVSPKTDTVFTQDLWKLCPTGSIFPEKGSEAERRARGPRLLWRSLLWGVDRSLWAMSLEQLSRAYE